MTDPSERMVDVREVVPPGDGPRKMAVRIFSADQDGGSRRPVVMCCLPGGGVDQRYWDLAVPGEDDYSFGRAMARSGHTVVTADHLSVGASSDAPLGELTVEVLADAAHHAMSAVLAELAPELGRPIVVGVGHSMGAMLTTILQARHGLYDAVALLGLGPYGLAEYLPPDLAEMAGRQEEIRSNLPQLMADRLDRWTRQGDDGGGRLPVESVVRPGSETADAQRRSLMHGEAVPRNVARAVRSISATPPPISAVTSMIPGSFQSEWESIAVPVFVGNGEFDITGAPRNVAAALTASPHVTAYEIPGAGHSHHAFEGRKKLWAALDAWCRSLEALVTSP